MSTTKNPLVKVEADPITETAAAAGEQAAATLREIEKLEAESVTLEAELEQSVLDSEAYAEKERAFERNKSERRRLERLHPLLEKKRDALAENEAQARLGEDIEKCNALCAIVADLYRNEYVKAAQTIALIGALEQRAQELVQGIVSKALAGNAREQLVGLVSVKTRLGLVHYGDIFTRINLPRLTLWESFFARPASFTLTALEISP